MADLDIRDSVSVLMTVAQGTNKALHVVQVSASGNVATTCIQYTGSGYTYFCEAVIGSARSDSVWRVLRKTDATGDLVYADTGAFDNAADDLATVAALTYTLGA